MTPGVANQEDRAARVETGGEKPTLFSNQNLPQSVLPQMIQSGFLLRDDCYDDRNEMKETGPIDVMEDQLSYVRHMA